MPSTLNPYIQFKDTARAALELYRKAFGGELTLMTFAQMGVEGSEADKVMHGQLVTEAGYTLMASDTPEEMEHTPGGNVSISVSGDDAENLRRAYDVLAEQGEVTMPLAVQQWGAEFGMVKDAYGVNWMFNINPGENA